MLAFLLTLPGCNVTKNFGPNEYLLIKNKIQEARYNIPVGNLEDYIQQRPNTKMFGLFRSNIAFYNMGSRGEDTKFKKWIRGLLIAISRLIHTSAEKEKRLILII